MDASTQNCKTYDEIVKRLKNCHLKIKGKKKKLSRFQTFNTSIWHISDCLCHILHFILYSHSLIAPKTERGRNFWQQRQSTEGMLVPGKKRDFLFFPPMQPMLTMLYTYCKRWLHFNYSRGVLTVLKPLQVFSGTEGDSFFVRKGWQPVVPVSKGFPYRQDPVPVCISDEMDMKSMTTNWEFLTEPVDICCIGTSTIQRGARALFK